jgi:hypothetical protein
MNHKTADKIKKSVMASWRKHPELSVFQIHQLLKDKLYQHLHKTFPKMTPNPLHDSHRGCKVIAKKQPGQGTKHLIEGRYCLTHKVDLCGSCSSEWSHGMEIIKPKKYPRKPYGKRKHETLISKAPTV